MKKIIIRGLEIESIEHLELLIKLNKETTSIMSSPKIIKIMNKELEEYEVDLRKAKIENLLS